MKHFFTNIKNADKYIHINNRAYLLHSSCKYNGRFSNYKFIQSYFLDYEEDVENLNALISFIDKIDSYFGIEYLAYTIPTEGDDIYFMQHFKVNNSVYLTYTLDVEMLHIFEINFTDEYLTRDKEHEFKITDNDIQYYSDGVPGNKYLEKIERIIAMNYMEDEEDKRFINEHFYNKDFSNKQFSTKDLDMILWLTETDDKNPDDNAKQFYDNVWLSREFLKYDYIIDNRCFIVDKSCNYDGTKFNNNKFYGFHEINFDEDFETFCDYLEEIEDNEDEYGIDFEFESASDSLFYEFYHCRN